MNSRVVKFFFIATSFTLFCIPDCQAQYSNPHKLDSLLRVYRNHPKEDSVKVNLLNAVSWQYYTGYKRDSAHDYADSASALAQKIGYKKGLATAYRYLGNYYSDNQDTASALKYYQDALIICKQINDLKGIIHNNRNLGLMFMNNYSKSQKYYQQALKFARKLKNPYETGMVYNNLGDLARNFIDYPQALGYYQKGMTEFKKVRDWVQMAIAHEKIGSIFFSMPDTTKGFTHLREELRLSRKSGNQGMTARALMQIAVCYISLVNDSSAPELKNKLLGKAVHSLQQAIEISRPLNDVAVLGVEYATIAHAFILQKNYESAIRYLKKSRKTLKKIHNPKGDWIFSLGMATILAAASDSLLPSLGIPPNTRNQTGIEYGKKALSVARKINNPSGIAGALQLLIPFYEKAGNYKAAYLSLKEYTAINKKAVGLKTQKGVVRKGMLFKFKQETAALNAEHEKEALKQRIIRNALIAGVILLLIFSVIVFLQRKKTAKARERAEHSERQKQRFFTNISHEFRTPLTLLMGPLEDLMNGGSVEDFKAILPEMHRNSRRLLRLINQLLDISRLDAEKYNVHPSRDDIIPFTQQIVHSFSSLAQAKNIDLEVTADPALADQLAEDKVNFYFDEDVFEKIIANLLSNAFKYTPKKGRIAVSLSKTEEHPGSLLLKVQDSGAGISKEMLPHIFDRFYQVENQNPKGIEGSGIGLALVKELVEVHGGKISVRSEEGAGTTFYCQFPLNGKGTAARHQPSTQKKPVPVTDENVDIVDTATPIEDFDDEGKPVILVVEDQQDVRKYICSRLKEQYQILEAQNGKQGWQTALEHIPALVISDVMMPEMDGFALCKALKTDQKTSHIPVILLTARAEDSDKMTGLETGADAYLIKPFNAKELVVRVRNLITSRNKMRARFSGSLVVKPAEIAVTSLDRELIDNLLKVVDRHLDDAAFSVDDLGEAVNMSTRQLNRKLKAIINQSPVQFIRSVRLQRAMEMLKNNSGNISEIAFKTGFETPSYFTKRFKEQFGCLPSEKEKFPQ